MKNKEIDYYKIIDIPHLKFKVYVSDINNAHGLPDFGSMYTCKYEDGAMIFIKDLEANIKEPANFSLIAHEVLHVIQIICEKYQMKIENEQEHTAYLMHYILNEILDYE